MILCNDGDLAKRAKHLTTQAKMPHKWDFRHDETGYNFRMPNVNAALGVAQLEYLDKLVENKRETASRYADFFNGTGIRFFTEPAGCRSNYWLNLILFENPEQRDKFLEISNGKGIMTRPAWILMHKLSMFAEDLAMDLEPAESKA